MVAGSELLLGMGDVLSTSRTALHRDFPDLHCTWRPSPSSLLLDIESISGSRSSARVGYPLDLGYAVEAARRHRSIDKARERVADRLVEWNVGGYQRRAGQAPYILHWLVFRQQVDLSYDDVVLVDRDGPEAWPASMSDDIETIASHVGPAMQQLQLLVEGAARLVRPRGRLPTGLDRTIDLDLTATPLREFRDLWLDRDDTAVESVAADLLASRDAMNTEEEAAINLLAQYNSGSWLRHDDFQRDVIYTEPDSPFVRWDVANQLSMLSTVATLQDRAVLAVACHLSGEVRDPHVPLAEALHYIGDARHLVLDCIGRLAGSHANPGAHWPVDCSHCP